MTLHYGKILIPVLFENNFCMILDKPSGLSVQGGKGVKISLDSILTEKITPRPLLVHRLDRDTSGVILVAKTKDAAGDFSKLLAGGKPGIVKQYLGVCSGIPSAQGEITLTLEQRGRQKKTETYYKLLSSSSASAVSFSFLELELGTGRMHQIRRHLAYSGYPLLGDDKYGDFSLNKMLRKTRGLKHLLLHASRLAVPPCKFFPDGLDISSPLPEYINSFLGGLTHNPHFP
ncbi:MAG: RluA family pseudouridine synthase [Treponema sp.]|jgi:23S rRNA pseudouridine955/2504/2580 synthase|nr:RluA family pseudouridine synthase [Treponema sp.]